MVQHRSPTWTFYDAIVGPATVPPRLWSMNDVDLTHPEPPIAGDETSTLLGGLERQRAIVAWKCGGLDSAALRKQHLPSAITLGGLLKHLALVEDLYFQVRLLGHSMPSPWNEVDWEANPGWEWTSAAGDSPEELMSLWKDAVARSREAVAEALSEGGMDQLARWKSPAGDSPSMRRILVDLVEEYARHAGHADLIRESVDGLVGEDPPRSHGSD